MIFTRGARITGAVLCTALAVVTAAWIVRDLTRTDRPVDLWWFWAGQGDVGATAPPVTSLLDPVLLAVYAAVTVTVMRSAVAASALFATGVLTFAVRLPGLWVLGSSWMDGRAPDELRTRALLCAFGVLAVAVALIVTALAGRGAPDSAYALTPTRPAQGVAVTSFLLLGAAAGIWTAWEVYWGQRLGPGAYLDRVTGESVLMPLLGTPPGWLNAVIVLLCLAAAVGALFGTPFSRPLGMVVSALLVGVGGSALATALRYEQLDRFGELTTVEQLSLASLLFGLGAGTLALFALARRGERDMPGAGPYGPAWGQSEPERYGQGGGGFGPPPPSSPPPGW
ncbi:hypothetical protein OIE71_22330 [Streptomyces sp. NBC_01725]|uniref:hypothetical protein n=1 Tax=Streptomyces sp. NBC_01725 TaxID=2975923 RepID=UPI002E2A98D7|nr:hypothetical protein [Streptomyces sp. NBC_01725]